MEICKHQENDTNVMTEAIFACKKVEELTSSNRFGASADLLAILPWLAENLFLCDCPGDACHGNSNNEKVQKLIDNIHRVRFILID